MRSNPVRVRRHLVRVRTLPAQGHWGPLRLDRFQVRPLLARIREHPAPGHLARDSQLRRVQARRGRQAHVRRDLQDRLVHVHQAHPVHQAHQIHVLQVHQIHVLQAHPVHQVRDLQGPQALVHQAPVR
jgi:hypothetical protein